MVSISGAEIRHSARVGIGFRTGVRELALPVTRALADLLQAESLYAPVVDAQGRIAARHLAGTAGLIGALALPLLTLALPRWEVRVLPALVRSPAKPVSSRAVTVSERSDFAPDQQWESVKHGAMEVDRDGEGEHQIACGIGRS